MIDFNKAIELAQEYFHEKGEHKLNRIFEAELIWVVYAGNRERPRYGSSGISIDKQTGEIKRFILPSKVNFEILKNAKLTELE